MSVACFVHVIVPFSSFSAGGSKLQPKCMFVRQMTSLQKRPNINVECCCTITESGLLTATNKRDIACHLPREM